MLCRRYTIDAHRSSVSTSPEGTPPDGGNYRRSCRSNRPGTSAASAAVTDCTAPAACSNLRLTVDNGAAFTRCSAAERCDSGVGIVTGASLVPRFTRPSTSSTDSQRLTTAPTAGGCLPSATAVLAPWEAECAPGMKGASLSRRASTPGLSPTSPNYTSRARVRLSRPIRSSSAPAGRAATAPSVFVDNSAYVHSTLDLRECGGKAVSRTPTGSAATKKGRASGARSVKPTLSLTAASPTTTAAPSISVRPLLRPHLPPQRVDASPDHTQASATTDAGNPTATHIRLTTFSRQPASAARRKALQNQSVVCTAPLKRLNPAALAGSGAPRTRVRAASLGSLGIRGGDNAGIHASSSRAASMFLGDLGDGECTSSSDAGSSSVAVARSPYFSRPSPPPRSVGHRCPLRVSSVSPKNNSPASSLCQGDSSPPDDEVTATLHLFNSTPDPSAFSEEAREIPRYSALDEYFTRGLVTSDPEGAGGTLIRGANATTATAASNTERNGSTCASEKGPLKQVTTNSVSPLFSPNTSKAVVHRVGHSGVVSRLKELGNTYLLREEFGQAIETYTKAIQLDPTQEALWSNRACAFLLTFRYLPAVADCLFLLSFHPGYINACWRAAKAYASTYQLREARKYYQLAQQASEREGICRRSSPIDGGMGFSPSIRAGVADDTFSGSIASAAVENTAAEAAESVHRSDRRLLKAQKDYQTIASEEGSLELVEAYWQHLRHQRWGEALEAMEKMLTLPSYAGPTAVSWKALRLEALLHLEPKKALAEAEALYRAYPDSLELYPVLVKAIFYDMHDAAATDRCLSLLDEASEKRRAQNLLLKEQVRYCTMKLHEGVSTDDRKTTILEMEAWAKQYELREDSRTAGLRHTIEKFVRYRDAGNTAYESGDWCAAAAAYTRCLETDPLNHALLAAVYCNRTAVYMQAGRWRDALDDAGFALSLSPKHATAYARRGRVQMYLLAQEYEGQRTFLARRSAALWTTAMKQRLQSYADAAVADLARAVELSPTLGHRTQLQQALAQRQAIQASLESAHKTSRGHRPSSGASFEGGGHCGQRPHSSPPPTAAQRIKSAAMPEVVGWLKLLGLSILEPSAPGNLGKIPDPKVISKAYRDAALRWHPDKWVTATPQEQQEAERQFKSISIAYQALREQGDAVLEKGVRCGRQ